MSNFNKSPFISIHLDWRPYIFFPKKLQKKYKKFIQIACNERGCVPLIICSK